MSNMISIDIMLARSRSLNLSRFVLLAYINRYIRLTVVLGMALLAYMFLVPLMGSGPHWNAWKVLNMHLVYCQVANLSFNSVSLNHRHYQTNPTLRSGFPQRGSRFLQYLLVDKSALHQQHVPRAVWHQHTWPARMHGMVCSYCSSYRLISKLINTDIGRGISRSIFRCFSSRLYWPSSFLGRTQPSRSRRGL